MAMYLSLLLMMGLPVVWDCVYSLAALAICIRLKWGGGICFNFVFHGLLLWLVGFFSHRFYLAASTFDS